MTLVTGEDVQHPFRHGQSSIPQVNIRKEDGSDNMCPALSQWFLELLLQNKEHLRRLEASKDSLRATGLASIPRA